MRYVCLKMFRWIFSPWSTRVGVKTPCGAIIPHASRDVLSNGICQYATQKLIVAKQLQPTISATSASIFSISQTSLEVAVLTGLRSVVTYAWLILFPLGSEPLTRNRRGSGADILPSPIGIYTRPENFAARRDVCAPLL